MAKTSASVPAPLRIVVGGDSFLNNQRFRQLRDEALATRPEAEVIELNAGDCDHYAFDEAVSPSLLSDFFVVMVSDLQNADEKLVEAMVAYGKEAGANPSAFSAVICQHAGGAKGKKIITQLTASAGAQVENVADLKKPEAKLNFVIGQFQLQGRRVDPLAAQQLVSVLGESTSELAAMCAQLCFDFEDDPMGVDRVNQYLTANPQVSGFAVSDLAIEGKTAQAVVALRTVLEQGTQPIAMVGALAVGLRTLAKASAVRSGSISMAEAKANPWAIKNSTRKLSGWTSQGLSACLRMLAWADEECKTSSGDPVYAVERAVELISHKGRVA
ncbi:DNA polymerase III subunit delta [Bifidobacterium aemilianum]|uniref:DNA-directed DNA polymerase n=1 Tax=Bifidobacterium aemilianum TaxID=2493120 RepID=A0A366KAL6_9BIFI|nr:DNA polymerase III subunit delta [Bifidobacterium aemilianum]RBP98153.1 DNA polymerase III subunit delta [Bifidobacterium aemilianum]